MGYQGGSAARAAPKASRRDAFDRDAPTPEQIQFERRLVGALIRRAQRARTNPADFFSFVMREEHGERRRITAAAHQRVLFDFVMAHQQCVVRMPAGASKTYCMTALSLWLLGCDPTERGVVISSTEDQAAKPVAMARDYIENKDNAFPELRLVFPMLRPSQRVSDPWTQEEIVVDRPPGIRDASLKAIGVDGALSGARLSWILVDDILSRKNTSTVENRKKVISWFNSTVLSRRDVGTARIVVCNTPWHPEDLTYALEKAGWPTITMDIEGGILVSNADEWDTDEIRPAFRTRGAYHRLTAHDSADYGAPLTIEQADGTRELLSNDNAVPWNDNAPPKNFDLDETIPLWPEKWSRPEIAKLRRDYAAAMHEFNQLYLCLCRDEDSSRCKVEWVERCKAQAIALGIFSLVGAYTGPNLTVTGVDIAIGRGKQNHLTSLFTYEVLPNGKRRLLDVECGRFKGKEIVTKIRQKSLAYSSLVRVESNAAQDFIRQWTLDEDASVPVRAHFTGENKHHPTFGVESIFVAMENECWIIPCDPGGAVHPAIQRWLDDCLYYKPPPAHTGDVLMSCWLATEQEREITRGRTGTDDVGPGGASSLLTR